MSPVIVKLQVYNLFKVYEKDGNNNYVFSITCSWKGKLQYGQMIKVTKLKNKKLNLSRTLWKELKPWRV